MSFERKKIATVVLSGEGAAADEVAAVGDRAFDGRIRSYATMDVSSVLLTSPGLSPDRKRVHFSWYS